MVREVVGQSVPAGIFCSFVASLGDASPAKEPHRSYDVAKRAREGAVAGLPLPLTLPLLAMREAW
jgi:hypothetical protein